MQSMKVKLLKEVGVHAVGTIVDVDPVIVIQLETDGVALRVSDVKTPNNSNNASVKKYLDKSGKEYTEAEVLVMDKRTGLYKEIMEIYNK